MRQWCCHYPRTHNHQESPPSPTCADYPPNLRGRKIVPSTEEANTQTNYRLALKSITLNEFKKGIMTSTTYKHRSEAQSAKAEEEMRRCTDWLLQFMLNSQPKFLTKSELRRAAIEELKVSKYSFNFAWINAIEQTGRHDWYQPLRRRIHTKN
jgi:hypothetical protein